jgi:hypothetical protein
MSDQGRRSLPVALRDGNILRHFFAALIRLSCQLSSLIEYIGSEMVENEKKVNGRGVVKKETVAPF